MSGCKTTHHAGLPVAPCSGLPVLLIMLGCQFYTHHVGLPVVSNNTLLDAPPEVVLGLSLPGEDGEASLSQGSSHFILGNTKKTVLLPLPNPVHV